MTKELSVDFLYVETARELWEELEHRFGESNGPILYQMKRNISLLTQGDLSLAQYHTKLKRLWSKLALLRLDPVCHYSCECNAFMKIAEYREEDKLLQFFMGLNDSYDHVINRILLMDVLTSINKAYSMLSRVEKQRYFLIDNAVQIIPDPSKEDATIFLQIRNLEALRNLLQKEGHVATAGNPYHSKDSYFQLIGYPDWYLDLNRKKK